MDSFELLSIPRFMGNDINCEEEVKHKTDSNKSDFISKLITQSNERKKFRLSLNSINEQNIDFKPNEELFGSDFNQTNDELINESIDKTEEIEEMVEDIDDITEEVEEDVNNPELNSDNFAIIGNVKKVKTNKVTPIVDKWMSKPIVFDRDIKNSQNLDQFSDIIDESLVSLLSDNRIDRLFPVQRQVIPYLLKSFNNSHIVRPKDVCVCSPTGSGKTLSFVLPIVQYLRKRVVTNVRVLVVLPVRDLAIQVFQVFQKYCQKSSLKAGLIVGHKSFAEECNSIVRKSIDGSKYHSLVDILVATPGKLVDMIQRAEGFSLRYLEILVLDESDRMLNELQFNWFQEIESSVFGNNRKHHCFCTIDGTDSEQQLKRYNIANECSCLNRRSLNSKSIHKILFSATLSTDPEKLKFISLFEPILFTVCSESNTNSDNRLETKKHLIPEELKEFMIIANDDRKPLIIWYLMEVLKYRKVLCFTGSVENSHRLYSLLKQMSDIVIAEYSSRLTAKKREKLLNRFICEKIDLIICSDIFARGLDIDGINYVICYDPPRNETQYIHRIGRTARAGNEGTAITLVTPKQLSHFNIICRRVHQKSGKSNDKNDLNVKKMILKESQLKPLMTKYNNALKSLSVYIKADQKKQKIMKRNFKH